MPLESRPAVRYQHGVTHMRPSEVRIVIENDTRTQPTDHYTSPQPARVGFMNAEEANDAIADGFTPIRHHRKVDLLQLATRAIAEVFATFTLPIGNAHHKGQTERVEGQRAGRRVVLLREGHRDAYATVQAHHAKRSVQPADFQKVGPNELRGHVHPDHRQKGLPTRLSLRRIATSSADAEQFTRQRGGDKTYRIPKEPLRSMRYELKVAGQQRQSSLRSGVIGKDGVTF